MRKSTKLAILVAALVALCSLTALAANTWKQDADGNWYCYDKDGNAVTGRQKSGDKYYYLDELTGAMVKNTLIDEGTVKRWYGEDGANVLSQWVKVPYENDDDGWEYMYFDSTGKAYTDRMAQSIKGSDGVTKKYWFDADGHMLYGYLTAAGSSADYPSAADYYYGTKEEGWRYTGWIHITDGSDENYSDDSSVWFYFKDGAKLANEYQKKVASGKKYNFNENGKMVTGWATAATTTSATVSTNSSYYGDSEDGLLKKSQWVRTAAFNKYGVKDDENETSYWYYLDSNGIPTYGELDEETALQGKVVKIKSSGKYYLFNQFGQMQSGIVLGVNADAADPTAFQFYDVSFDTLTEYKNYVLDKDNNEVIMYFSGDEENDGAMKTGSQTITIDGDEATVVFDKYGVAYEGVKSKKIYNNGILQTAGSSRVAVKKLNTATDDYAAGYYLVSASGNILNKYRAADEDGVFWLVTEDNVIYKFADKDYASQASAAVLKQGYIDADGVEFKVGSENWIAELDPSKDGTGYKFINFHKQ